MNEIKATELNLSSKAEDILLQIESNTICLIIQKNLLRICSEPQKLEFI
ncbi:hypothetical protein [Fundicoccus ignavus]|uniref:Uncharacterized protein n=1 Tax=Fundicoccus ignavus TaxID=2664442 RepID=A0A6I2GB41_9LACT|nr:hypothetical protein [Fundicoccus ignavus]MRI84436.1 hypothetical protein [Fundicoccus ignavus]MRJ47265.1 hypothetical protein [Fundicoccus ignavus]